MARREARCSTGWWVGPSSPRPDGVVGPRIDDVRPRERGEADGGAHVVGEAEEGPADRQHAPVLRHAVHGRRPCRARGSRSGPGSRRAIRRDWISAPLTFTPLLPVRSAEPASRPGSLATVASMHWLMACRVASWVPASKPGRSSAQPGSPCPACAASQAARSPSQAAKRSVQAAWRSAPAGDLLAVELAHLVGDPEGLVRREAQDLLGHLDLLGAERRAVGRGGVGQLRARASRCGCAARGGSAWRRARPPARRGPRGWRPRARRRRWPSRRGCARASRRPRSARRGRRRRPARSARRS